MNKIHSLLAIGLLFALASCNREDLTNPGLELVNPQDQAQYLSGEDINLTAKLTDDKALLQYTVIIEPVSGYGKIAHPISGISFSNTFGASGKALTATQVINIPVATGTGEHILTAFVTDNAGNRSPEIKINLFIQNSEDQEIPGVTFAAAPSPVNAGGTLVVSGTATDNKELGAVFLTMTKDGATAVEMEDHLIGTSSSFTFNVTAPTVPGTYKLKVLIADKANNRSFQEIDIVVI